VFKNNGSGIVLQDAYVYVQSENGSLWLVTFVPSNSSALDVYVDSAASALVIKSKSGKTLLTLSAAALNLIHDPKER
jgi:hypothetical protein